MVNEVANKLLVATILVNVQYSFNLHIFKLVIYGHKLVVDIV